MHHILDPKILAKYLEAVKDDLEETAPEFEPVFTNVHQYYGNSLISFTNTIDDLLLQLLILIKLKVQVPMSLFSIKTAPVPLDAETYLGEKREYTQIIPETELIALLCSHINNIYNKLAELQRQIKNCHMHMNPGDTVQIEAPDFNPDIDGVSSSSTYKIPNKLLTKGTALPAPEITEPENECPTPATSSQQLASQDTDWLDAIPVQFPSLIDQPEDQGLDRHQTKHNSERIKIPDLEENFKEEQFADLDSYLAHHNTYEASQYICQEYRSHLYALDDDQYYAEIDCTSHMRHWLLKITSRQIKHLDHAELQKS